MGVRFGIAVAGVALAALGFLVAGVTAPGALAHRSPCHSAHTCPSDHHTYVWIDPATGFVWDCAEPGASEYSPALDTTTIVYDGLTYYCRAATPTTTTTSTTTPAPPTVVLPERDLTPGAFNPKVRQSTIGKTICRRGWTKTIRPPVGYTNALKLQQMTLYGESGPPSGYEEDHFIPLELGGAPRNPKNLWPEPHGQSRVSDPLETKLKRQVCNGVLSLRAARADIRAFKDAQG
jgi:hypothetical protein